MLRFLVLLLWIPLAAAPFGMLIIVALQPGVEPGAWRWLPAGVDLSTFSALLFDPAWQTAYLRSLVHATASTVIALVVALPAGYALARLRPVSGRQVMLWFLAARFIAAPVLALPLMTIWQHVAVGEVRLAVVLAHLVLTVPVAVWIVEGAISRVPVALDEMAFADGYSLPRYLLTLLARRIAGAIGAAVLVCFTLSWNEFFLTRLLRLDAPRSLAGAIDDVMLDLSIDWSLVAAASLLSALPVLVLLVLVRRHAAFGYSLGRTG